MALLMTQFTLLLWKNFTLRRRQKVRLLVEILWPLFLFIILVGVRTTNKPVFKSQCHYPNKAMPSAGVLPWLQGIICNLDNPCLEYPTPGEAPGQVNNFNNSVVAGFLIEFQDMLVNRSFLSNVGMLVNDLDQWDAVSSNINGQSVPLRSLLNDDENFSVYLRDELSVPPPVVQSLMKANVTIDPMMAVAGDPRGVLCEGTAPLDEFIQFQSQAEKEAFVNVSCSLEPQQLRESQRMFLQNLDQRKLLTMVASTVDASPAQTAQLMQSTVMHVGPVVREFARLQQSAAFQAARSLDFRANMMGSINLMLCGKTVDFNSTNATRPRMDVRETTASVWNSSTNSSGFCETLITTLEETPGLRYLWGALRPLVQGKVLYTPDTPAARLLVTQANATFNALAMLKELSDSWEEVGPRIWTFLNSSAIVEQLRVSLENPVFAAILDQQLDGTGLTSALIAGFLYSGPPGERPPGGGPQSDWRDAYRAAGQAAAMFSQLLGCLDLNKFEPASTEQQLVSRALELLQEERFWAGVVFENLPPNTTQLPAYVQYTIRMDIDEVERTDEVKRRSWSPGAKDSLFNDLRYIWGGFAYLQDMLDSGVARAHGSTPLVGVYAQQMPYPCYVNDGFIGSIGVTLPMFFVLAFTYSVCMTVKSLVLEKELGLKEVLRSTGVPNSALWCAWFTENMTLLLVPCLLLSVMLKSSKKVKCEQLGQMFLRSLASSLPLFMTLAWIFSVALIVKGIVQEKEARLKETMRIMGLRTSIHWLTWAFSSMLPLAVSAALLAVLLK
ncbi:unnamed protein product, partial [Arctogadus glacialis]